MKVEFRPATRDRWRDIETLFGERGACGGCWCMWWRRLRAEYEEEKGAGNRRAMRELVESGMEPGVLAYVDAEPAGWCAVAPRDEYPRLARSRIARPIDDRPVWSIVCLFVDKRHRKRGLSVGLIDAARKLAVSRGARIVEAYPVTPPKERTADTFVYHGVVSAFERAGFEIVARPSPTRRVVRWQASEKPEG